MFSWKANLGLATLLLASSSPAATIFADGFESNAASINAPSLNGWTVARSSIDVVGVSVSFNCHGGLRCVDMDGTSLAAGRIETATDFTFSAGLTYTLTFWVSRNQRGFYGPDTMTACLSTECETITLPESVPGSFTWEQHTLTLVGSGTTGKVWFDHLGGDNVGLLIDDVRLADNSVPEPGTFALLGTALALVAARRRAA